ncbi:hypothetical protein BgAZ_501590 [Babesia gibsoni]|uniref:Pinin/SDK/MemA protein domain-containing protein n=1 Tax=Babesia gibsoni TaxID=33632 RepID=A0AAD8PD55_BABGI|nr:hypothetical protein BgAZ_501590 [Babesia gibsoni]
MDPEAVLTREIRAILRERRSLKSSIRRLSNQIDSDGATTLLSTRGVGDALNGQKWRAKRQMSMDVEPEVEPEKRPKLGVPVDNVEGHRRILRAGLLGHLQRARDSLVKERERESTQKQIEKERVVESRLEKQEQEKIKTLSEELQAELASKKQSMELLETKLTQKNNEYVKMQLTRHYQCMGNFIATKTQPTVFWVPRNFNPDLEALRDSTKQFIEQKLAAIAATDYFSKDVDIN